MLTSRRKIFIEWGDCDPAGIVFYPRYFEWFDACTAALFALAGYPKQELLKAHGIAIPIVDTRSRFLIPSRFGDEVTVEGGEDGIRFLLVSGQPLREPVAWYGPIVMNTQTELRQAFEELDRGTFLKKNP